MKVLLTGAAGFVARPVHDQLLAAGHTIRAFDRLLDRRDDITDHDRLLVAASGCDAVIHLAAKVGLGISIPAPRRADAAEHRHTLGDGRGRDGGGAEP